MINAVALDHMTDLFRFRWDPAVLAVLAERSFRYRALHARLESHSGEHIDDNALTRSLRRLTHAGSIQTDSDHFGNRMINIYALTDIGRDRLMIYEALAAAYVHLRLPENDCDGSCPIHSRRPSAPAG